MLKAGLQSERDELQQKVHDGEIRQLTNKYKLDKIAESLFDTLAALRHLAKSTELDTSEYVHSLERCIYHLESVRDDMARTRELVKSQFDVDAQSVRSLATSTATTPRSTQLRKTESTASAQSGASRTPYNFLERQSSTGSDLTFNNWQERIADLRRRSPSPSPRKMTAYPEAPPSIVISGLPC